MLTQIRRPSSHFSSFYEDNSILIQFMIEELIRIHQLTCNIQALVEKNLDSTDSAHSPASLRLSFIQIFGELIGCTSENQRTAPSCWTKGPLTKLKEYCEKFSHNSAHENKQHLLLHRVTVQAWLMVTYSFNRLNSLSPNDYTTDSNFKLFLLRARCSFQKLQKQFNQMSRYISLILNSYCNNENVIYYLMRKKESLLAIYDHNFLSLRFKWAKKTPDLIRLLIHRYQIRGFEALLPSIQHLFESDSKEELRSLFNSKGAILAKKGEPAEQETSTSLPFLAEIPTSRVVEYETY